MFYPEAYHSALALQRLIAKEGLKASLDSKLRPSYARAFVELEMLKLRMRMRPAPKPIDVSVKPLKRPRNVVAFTEQPVGSGNQSQKPNARPGAKPKAGSNPHPNAEAGPEPTSQASEASQV